MSITNIDSGFKITVTGSEKQKSLSSPSMAAEWLEDYAQLEMFYSKLEKGAMCIGIIGQAVATAAAVTGSVAAGAAVAAYAENRQASRAAGRSEKLFEALNIDLKDSQLSQMSVDDFLRLRSEASGV